MDHKFADNGNEASFFKCLPANFAIPDTPVADLLLREYGSVFVARGGVAVPRQVVFSGSAPVSAFQNGLDRSKAKIGEYEMELQTSAMNALLAAVSDALAQGLSITPRGPDSAGRNYNGTVELWNSRVEPALVHWVEQGRITQREADNVRSLSPFEQVTAVLELEAKGIWFAKDLSKSIIYSVAPPGTSQHLALLAFDVAEFDDERVRAILSGHGWHQTVTSDLPHFTYLGMPESELPGLGLKRVMHADRVFWVPDI